MSGEAPRPGRLEAAVCLVLAASGGLALLLGLWMALSGVPDFRGRETNVLFTIQKWMGGAPLYTDPARPPFEMAQYSPGYYLLVGGAARALGIAPERPAAIAAVGRLLSLGSFVLTLALAYRLMVRSYAVPRRLAAAACGFVAAVTVPWSFLLRPDALLGLCGFASFALLVRAAGPPGRTATAALAGSVAVGLAGCLVKQNGVQALMIVAVGLALLGAWRRLAAAGAAALVGGVALLLGARGLFGPALAQNVVAGLDNGLDLSNAAERAFRFLFVTFAPVLGALAVAGRDLAAPGRPARDRLLLGALGVSFLLATASALKIGSAEHYYDDFLLLAAVAVAAWVAERRREVPAAGRPSDLALVAAVWLMLAVPGWLGLQVLHYVVRTTTRRLTLVVPRDRQFATYEPLAERLRRELAATPDRKVLSFERPLDNLLPTRCIAPQKELLEIVHARGVVDYAELRRWIEGGRVRFVVVRRGERPREWLGASLERFEHRADVGEHALYERRPE